MVANLLRSERAVQTSVHVVRAFVQLRQMIATNKELARRLDELEARYEVKRVLTPFSLEVKRVLTPFSLSTRNSSLSSTPSGNSWRPRNRNPGGGSGSSRTTDKLERRGSRVGPVFVTPSLRLRVQGHPSSFIFHLSAFRLASSPLSSGC